LKKLITNIVGIQTDEYKFDCFIEKLQEIVIEEDFENLKDDFMEKYCEEFEEKEENKLSYMNIFKEYNKIVESYIEKVINNIYNILNL
jgi:ADP-ribosylation factor 2-binding protein